MRSIHGTLVCSVLLTTSVAISAPSGDPCDCSNPAPLAVGENEITHTLTGCEVFTFACAAEQSRDTAFYAFTPPKTGLYSFSTCNAATFDTVLGVATGCDGPFLACNAVREFCGSGSRIGVVPLEAGQTYIVTVGSRLPNIALGFATLSIEHVESCELETPTYVEAEPCGADLNGGCDSASAASETIVLGDTIQGSLWTNPFERDTDWYFITLAEDTELTLSLRSGIPAFAEVVDVSCASVIGEAASVGCPATTSVCLIEGNYLVKVTPFLAEIPCDGTLSSSYTLKVTGIPCTPLPSCSELCVAPTPLALGASPFANSATQCAIPFFGQVSYNTEYYSFTPAASGVYTLSTCGSASDTALAIYLGCSGDVLAYNDDAEGCFLASRIPSVVLEGGVTYTVTIGSIRPDELASGTITIGAYQSCELGSATVTEAELCSDDLNGGCNVTERPSEPISLGDIVGGTFFSSAALRDTDWYRLNITQDTRVSLSIRSKFASLAAIVGSECGNILAQTRAGDCPGTASSCLQPGEYFVFVVPTFGLLPCGIYGDYRLAVTGIPCSGGGGGGGDACSSVRTAIVGPNLFLSQNTGAVLDMTGFCDPGPSGDDRIYNTNYFAFTAPQSGTYSLSTCQFASFDTKLAVMTACGNASAILACNDDGAGCFSGTTSLVSGVDLQAGATYFVAVGGASPGSAAGSLLLSIEPEQVPPPCRPDLNSDGLVDGFDLTAFLAEWGAPPISRSDFNLDGSVDGIDLTVLLSAWGACAP
jgi:hypothetical protein